MSYPQVGYQIKSIRNRIARSIMPSLAKVWIGSPTIWGTRYAIITQKIATAIINVMAKLFQFLGVLGSFLNSHI